MNPADLTNFVQQTLWITLITTVPVVMLATIAGVLVSLVQAATQIQDQTLPFLAKLVLVLLCLMVLGPWMAFKIRDFAILLFDYMVLL